MNEPPRFDDDEYMIRDVSGDPCPSIHVMAMRFVAPAPLGAPLAMSTDGTGERSLRAPATPSRTQRRIDGSRYPQVSNAPNSVRGRDQRAPPSSEVISWIWPSAAPAAAANW